MGPAIRNSNSRGAMTASARSTQSDVARAVSGARNGDLAIGSVTIDPNGNIMVTAKSVARQTNPWGAVLKPKASQ